jgi:hypothetical protein
LHDKPLFAFTATRAASDGLRGDLEGRPAVRAGSLRHDKL